MECEKCKNLEERLARAMKLTKDLDRISETSVKLAEEFHAQRKIAEKGLLLMTLCLMLMSVALVISLSL